MADIKVRAKGLIILVFLTAYLNAGGYAQQGKAVNTILANLTSTENKKVITDDRKNAVYILITKRMCENCFKDICTYLAGKYSDLGKHTYAIYFMEKDLMHMLQSHARFSESVPCAQDIYFYWTNKVDDTSASKIYLEPSPQLIIVQDGRPVHIPYNQTIKLTHL